MQQQSPKSGLLDCECQSMKHLNQGMQTKHPQSEGARTHATLTTLQGGVHTEQFTSQILIAENDLDLSSEVMDWDTSDNMKFHEEAYGRYGEGISYRVT